MWSDNRGWHFNIYIYCVVIRTIVNQVEDFVWSGTCMAVFEESYINSVFITSCKQFCLLKQKTVNVLQRFLLEGIGAREHFPISIGKIHVAADHLSVLGTGIREQGVEVPYAIAIGTPIRWIVENSNVQYTFRQLKFALNRTFREIVFHFTRAQGIFNCNEDTTMGILTIICSSIGPIDYIVIKKKLRRLYSFC